MKRVFLHIGCGHNRKDQTTRGFNSPEWDEVRLDINPVAKPDVLGSMTHMPAVADASMDALFSSHNIEHLYPHEVPGAFAEFRRVLRPDGFAVITCPDLQSICAHVAQGNLTDPVYQSPGGPISPIDVIFGHRAQVAAGNQYMAHRGGFTQKSLVAALQAAGFEMVASVPRGHPKYDLWAVASVRSLSTEQLQQLALAHFP